jgi:hypothetical protein
MRHRVLIGTLLVVGASAPVSATQLSNDDLMTAVAGKTVTIDTPLGLPITVNYGANGMMTGSAGTALAVYLGAGKDRGRWQVRNGKLCQKWFKWLSGDTTCLTLRQNGSKIHWSSDEGQTGTATIETGPPAFDGVTASGLGVLPRPKKEAPKVAAAAPPSAAKDEAPPSRAGEQSWEAAAVRKAAPRHDTHAGKPNAAREPAPAAHEPQLVRAVAPAVRPRVVMASLAPTLHTAQMPRIAEPSIARLERSEGDDPFAAPAHAMRQALDEARHAALEHRWCLANAFAKGPAPPTGVGRFASPELVSVPSLLAIAQEQAYQGELPLHEPSCLTEEPGLNVVTKLATPAG